ncbi:hypothetical protein LTR86_003074 [Recurvomyces mirabilis]|nr:hypothetical protein LTR86_003074 [Recurvomyces mirabilis]
MWLINVDTRRLHWHAGETLPRYAILSHTWGDDEVTFQDMHHQIDRSIHDKAGYRKIDFTCNRAEADGLYWAWVDTCCIDKSSSAELSEAINSMFRWYHNARVCYAYLADFIHNPTADELTFRGHDSFSTSRWFTRGWTLQELIAPGFLKFYDCAFNFICSRGQIVSQLVSITGIPGELMARDRADPDRLNETYRSLARCSIAQRMSWASRRRCTREEDRAYSLFGIFSVNLPMLYGEGRGAFTRLQEEILRTSTDHSIFAWRYTSDTVQPHCERYLLAPSPQGFFSGSSVATKPSFTHAARPYDMTNLGLRMTVFLAEETSDRSYPGKKALSMALDCIDPLDGSDGPPKRYFLTLFQVDETADVYHLDRYAAPLYAAKRTLDDYKQDTIFVLRDFGQSWELTSEVKNVDSAVEGLNGSGDSTHTETDTPMHARSERSPEGAKRRRL